MNDTRCPFKFNTATLDAQGRTKITSSDACLCEGSKCELWTEAFTTEGLTARGCAFRLGAKKNSEGKIVV